MNEPTQAPLPFDQPPPLRRRRKPNVASSEATAEARRLAYEALQGKCGKRLRLILHALADYGPMTAREVLRVLIRQGHLPPTAERNATSPRLSEAANAGLVEALPELRVVGNDAPATVWRLTERGMLMLDQMRRKGAG